MKIIYMGIAGTAWYIIWYFMSPLNKGSYWHHLVLFTVAFSVGWYWDELCAYMSEIQKMR